MNKVILDMALRQCKTASDFEALIEGLEKPVDVRGNFAVIDAVGNAVFYEVGPNGFVKYSASDPLTAPDGYLVRTNYSLSGDQSRMVGEDRRMSAERFARECIASGRLNGRYIMQNLPRYLVHSDGTVLYDVAPNTWNDESPTDFDGYIPRYSSTNAMLIQGVKAGESPLLTTCWSITGPPMSTVALPLFITPNDILPEKVQDGWLSEKGQTLKAVIFPYSENMTKIIDLSKLYNREETGIMQRILNIEYEIMERGNALITDARLSGSVSEESLENFYLWLDDYIEREYSYNFDDIVTSVALVEHEDRQRMKGWGISGLKLTNPRNPRGVMVGKQRKYMSGTGVRGR